MSGSASTGRRFPRTVFMLGAGANQVLKDRSHSSPPLGNNLFEVAWVQGRLRSSQVRRYLPVFRYIERFWHRNADSLVASHFDLEECVSLVDSQIEDAPTKAARRDLQQIRWLLLSLLGETLADFRPSESWPRADAFGYLCGLLRSGPVITFNYDCLVEDHLDKDLPLDAGPPSLLPMAPPEIIEWFRSAFGEASEWGISVDWSLYYRLARYGIQFDEVLIHPAGPQEQVMPGELCYRNLPPVEHPLLKLHGSLNWFRYVARDDSGRRVTQGPDRSDRLVFAPEWAWERRERDLPTVDDWIVDPIVVAPTWAKEKSFGHASLRRIFASLWDQATAELARCDRLVVIGYSLPRTDFRTIRLFREAFANGPPAEVILVNRSGELIDRLKDLTGLRGKVRHLKGVEEFLWANGWADVLIPLRAAGLYEIYHPWTGKHLYGFGGWTPRIRIRRDGRIGVAWAKGPLPRGYVCDVQVSRPGGDGFSDWLVGTRQVRSVLCPDAPGQYQFRARARRRIGAPNSEWSEASTIDISSPAP